MDSESFQLAVFSGGLPTIMPGEVVPETSHAFGAYDPDGKLLTTDSFEAANMMVDWELRRDHHFLTSLTYQDKSFEISTVWLALNHNYLGGPPLVWETMAQSDDWLNFQARYSTTAAALNGHLTIVSVLLGGGMHLVESNVAIPGHEVHTNELEEGEL